VDKFKGRRKPRKGKTTHSCGILKLAVALGELAVNVRCRHVYQGGEGQLLGRREQEERRKRTVRAVEEENEKRGRGSVQDKRRIEIYENAPSDQVKLVLAVVGRSDGRVAKLQAENAAADEVVPLHRLNLRGVVTGGESRREDETAKGVTCGSRALSDIFSLTGERNEPAKSAPWGSSSPPVSSEARLRADMLMYPVHWM
jgi:hypothetical protein